MKNKFVVIGVAVALVAGAVVFLSYQSDQREVGPEQEVLRQTLSLSREYVALRFETDNLLIEARDYATYAEWSTAVDAVVARWQTLENASEELAVLGEALADGPVALNLIPTAYGYDKSEITRIFDQAPAGKKIATLAKHLGVDAKRAYAILTQDQAQLEADAWNEAGDTFKKLEASAVAIKNTSKIVTFVGTVVMTGGTSALAAGSTLTQAAVVVAGADLTLEITDDAAKIALGDQNKLSAIAGSARKVTEPAAAILMIADLPSNVSKGIDILGATTFGADQLNSTVQDGKVIGISLPTAKKRTAAQPDSMEVSVLEPTELADWLQAEEVTETNITPAELQELLTPQESEMVEAVAAEAEEETVDTQTTYEDTPRAIRNADNKMVLIKIINTAGETWVMDSEPYGSAEYRGEVDGIDAEDFAVPNGGTFMEFNQSAATFENDSGFRETSNSTYEYKLQLVAGGTMPEDDKDSYVWEPFVAVVDFVIEGTYGQPAIIVWDGASFRQTN